MNTVAGLAAAVLSGDVGALDALEAAIASGIEDAPKGLTYHVVMTKATKRGLIAYPAKVVKGAFAVVDAKAKTIRIFGIKNPTASDLKYRTTYDRTFGIGDTVEYDSYNLAYHGTIKAISASGVTVAKPHSSRAARLDLDVFTWRNYDLDLGAAFMRNMEVLQNT